MNLEPGTILAERHYDRLVLLQAGLSDERDEFEASARVTFQTALIDSHGQMVIADQGGATITLSQSAFETLIKAVATFKADQETRSPVTIVSGDNFDPFLDSDDLP
jgi:hypothetical protein